ncbi:hypothetical protein [Endozoicomonas numazuensis]|uniref:Uncharacterized protein n=1 Tax=Endozoicomonas numazuensis TaxID=1137799 RepID=A0A081NJV5_9GAMM|nr:hypothetical protein [Endozoicomonas numazuensis]KEQ18728.1 hypothetical protein GZ78_01070 [Endozoicomonas numazuensis]
MRSRSVLLAIIPWLIPVTSECFELSLPEIRIAVLMPLLEKGGLERSLKTEQLNGSQQFFRDPVMLMPIGAQSQEQLDSLQKRCPKLVAFIRNHQWVANRQEGIERLIGLLLVNHSMASLLERMIVKNELEDDAQANLLVMLGANPQVLDMLESFPELQVYQWLLQLPAHPGWIAELTPLYDKPFDFQRLLNRYHRLCCA